MKRRWKLYSKTVRELVAKGKNDRVAAALVLEGYRRPPGGDRVHDDIVTLIKTEGGLEGSSLHPLRPRGLRELVGCDVKKVWRTVREPQIRSAVLDAVASGERLEPEEVVKLPKDYSKAAARRAKVLADVVEDFGKEVTLVGYSPHVAMELEHRGLLDKIVDKDPRLKVGVGRNVNFDNQTKTILATGMILSNGSLRRFLAFHRGPLVVYSQSCPYLTAVLTLRGTIDAAVVEEFPYHFCPGHGKLKVYKPK